MKTKRTANGIALLEVLIAAIILALGLFALIAFQADLVRERTLISQRQTALSIADDKLQYFNNYTVIATTPGQLAYDDMVAGTYTSTSTSQGATYTLTWVITDGTLPDRKEISSTVTWSTPAGDSTITAQTVTLNMIIVKQNPLASGKVALTLP